MTMDMVDLEKDQQIYWRYKGTVGTWSIGTYVASPADGLLTIKGLGRFNYHIVSRDEIEWKTAVAKP